MAGRKQTQESTPAFLSNRPPGRAAIPAALPAALQQSALVGAARSVLLALTLLAACQQKGAAPSPAAKAGATTPLAPPGGEYPRGLDRSRYAGSAACKQCHAEEHAAWLASPHGRAVSAPPAVLGDFGKAPLAVQGGEIGFLREEDRLFMETRTPAGTKRYPVDLALGSGRQHQDYFTRDASGALHLLPAIWATRERRWLPSSLYQPASLDPASGDHWLRYSLVDQGCANCHMSQGSYRQGAHGVEAAYLEGPVNCESCHGAALEHVEKRRAGAEGGRLRALADLGPVEEARLCGTCHGARFEYRSGPGPDGATWFAAATLREERLLPDGRQHLTAYQYSGHLLSACFSGGGLYCKSCHAPHTGRARSLDGASAEGDRADLQCTACHRDLAAAPKAKAHAHHQKQVRCVACHMAPTWIGGTPERAQRTADHSISIPRPAEGLATSTPDACTTCHQEKGHDARWALAALGRWQAKRALQPRDWVLAIDAGRKRAPGASSGLRALLDEGRPPYLMASALELLALQPPDASLAPALETQTHAPDPWLRTLAYGALLVHEAPRLESLRDRALLDPHPLVRQTLFPKTRDRARVTAAGVEQFVADSLDWCQRPAAHDLYSAAQAFSLIGSAGRAQEALELADRWATEREKHGPDAAAARAALQRLGGGRPR